MSWYNAYITELLIAHNQRFEVAEEHDGTEGVIAAVEAGRGVALVYDGMAQTIGKRLALRQLTPPLPEAPSYSSIRRIAGMLWSAASSRRLRLSNETPPQVAALEMVKIDSW